MLVENFDKMVESSFECNKQIFGSTGNGGMDYLITDYGFGQAKKPYLKN